MNEYSGTSPKKGRGRSAQSLALIKAMYSIAEATQPITGRGVGYKLFKSTTNTPRTASRCTPMAAAGLAIPNHRMAPAPGSFVIFRLTPKPDGGGFELFAGDSHEHSRRHSA